MFLEDGFCPLGRFKHEHGIGAYTNDPVEECLKCNFNALGKCHCPRSMTWDEYDILREKYLKSCHEENPTKIGFCVFVGQSHLKSRNNNE